MYISQESVEESDVRLTHVLSLATLTWHDGPHAFREYPATLFPSHETEKALAFVRDEEVWSVLAISDDTSLEQFQLFSFHFPAGVDNSGFVGWLATKMKRELGTGVFVVCGQNTGRGGIFDYWGVPVALAAQARDVIAGLVDSAK